MTTNTTTITNKPTIELLTLLHQYESLHTNANDNLKSCIFNITKARKFRSGGASCVGGSEYSPNDVREELRAQVLLEYKGDDVGVDGNNSDESEPNLVNEDISDGLDDDVGTAKNQHGSCGKGDCRFVLHLDGMKSVQQQQAANESAQKQTNVSIENTKSEGLRRRRGGNTATSTHGNTDNEATDETNKWTKENVAQPTTIQNEEERLRYADPLNLFGVPPPALRVAQTKSRCAIAYYVEVANLAREIMMITNNEQSK